MSKNVLVVTYWSLKDALIQSYTLPYVEIIRKNLNAGEKIFVFTIEQNHFKVEKEDWKQLKRKYKEEKNIILLRTKYHKFGLVAIFSILLSILKLAWICLFNKIGCIHTWCTPAGGLGYILSVITGKKLILDSFEPHAELMLETNTWKKSSLAYKLLKWLEKKQAQRASAIITTTATMVEFSRKNYKLKTQKLFIKPACVDLNLFKTQENNTLKGSLDLLGNRVMVYAGKIGGIYLEDELFLFVKTAYDFWNKKFKFLMLTSIDKLTIDAFVRKHNIPDNIVVSLFVPFTEIPKYLSLADFAINTMKPVPSRKYSAPIKDGEYWAMGLPIVITKNISDDSDIIEKHDAGYVLSDFSQDEFICACNKIEILLQEPLIKERVRDLALKYRKFTIAENIYKELYYEK